MLSTLPVPLAHPAPVRPEETGFVAVLTPVQRRIHAAALRLFAERGITQVNVSELAQAASVARGTIYNNLPDPEGLFEAVAAELADDMNQRIVASFADESDPARRLANGIRLYIRRAHEEPHWGRFLSRFAYSNASLQALWQGPVAADLAGGLQSGRYAFRDDQLPSAIGLLAGAVLSGILLVLEGIKTWREAGADAAELVLVALGLPREEARAMAGAEIPAGAASGQ